MIVIFIVIFKWQKFNEFEICSPLLAFILFVLSKEYALQLEIAIKVGVKFSKITSCSLFIMFKIVTET